MKIMIMIDYFSLQDLYRQSGRTFDCSDNNIPMDIVYHLPEHDTPSTIKEVVASLNTQKIRAKHDKKDWGDWIHLEGKQTVISIESIRGLTRSATIELSESDPDTLLPRITKAFASLGWYGCDEDGEYKL